MLQNQVLNLAMKVCSFNRGSDHLRWHTGPELDPEADNAALTKKFEPLLKWMKGQATHVVRDGALRDIQCDKRADILSAVVISNRLVSSPCAIVADFGGYTANVERLISAHAACSQEAWDCY
jgi:hypothetical protein